MKEVGKLYAGWVLVQFMYLNYMQSVIYKSRDPDITIAFFLKHELCWMYKM